MQMDACIMQKLLYDDMRNGAITSPISAYFNICKLIWRHSTYKMPVIYILSSVWVWLGIFSQLPIVQCVGQCVFSLLISFVMIERIYILCLIIIIKSEVWTITHCLGLGHETMVCAVCLSILFWNMRSCPQNTLIMISSTSMVDYGKYCIRRC